MLQTLRSLSPRHKLIATIMSGEFIENYAGTMHEKLRDMGASFKFIADNPETVFLENGYRHIEKVSIIEKAVVFGSPNMPPEVLDELLPTLPVGLAIHVFEAS